MSFPTRVTAIQVDGNSISFAALSSDDGTLHIESLDHVELDHLVEVTKRVRHPVFMDVVSCTFPEKELIARTVRAHMERQVYQNPVVTLIGAEKMSVFQLIGEDTAKARATRRRQLLDKNIPINPYDFPCVIALTENTLATGASLSTMIRVRLADVFPLSQLLEANVPEFLGSVTGLTAAARALGALQSEDEDVPLTLFDVGKLRTLYTTRLPEGHVTFNAIPVGLARDDMHYFKSIPMTTEKILELKMTLGSLLFPPDATPLPSFGAGSQGWISTPQFECTRFATQVAHYGRRCLDFNVVPYVKEGRGEAIHYLSGRASRLPGFRQFLETAVSTKFRRIDRRPLRGMEVASGIPWADAADNLLTIGAAAEILSPDNYSLGAIFRNFVPPPISRGRCSSAALEDRQPYVFEQRIPVG